MDVSVKKIDSLNAVLTVKISNEDYKTPYESSLKNHRKQMQLPGFRKGRVPTSIIKKKYGPSILAEEIDKLLNKSIYDHITENKLNILGNPLPIEDEKIKIDWNQPSDFEFKYELGLAPEILPDLPGRLKYTKYQPKINEALVDKQIDDYARRYGKLTSVDKAGERDMIMANFKELDQSGNIVIDGFNQSSTVSLEFITDKKSKKKLTGCKPTDTFQLDPKKISRGEADMAAMLGIDKEKAPTTNLNIEGRYKLSWYWVDINKETKKIISDEFIVSDKINIKNGKFFFEKLGSSKIISDKYRKNIKLKQHQDNLEIEGELDLDNDDPSNITIVLENKSSHYEGLGIYQIYEKKTESVKVILTPIN